MVHFPLSPQRGFKVTAKWSSEKPPKQEEIVVGHGLTTIFLYIVHRSDGLPLGSNSHQSVKFCYASLIPALLTDCQDPNESETH